MLEFLRRWMMSEHSKPVEDFKRAADRVSEESRRLTAQMENCTWDEIARGLIGKGPGRARGKTKGNGNNRGS